MGSNKGRSHHGLSDLREYQAWTDMRSRCKNPKHKCFKDYGARGIDVCSEWNQFPIFYAQMGPRPSSKHSLERIDNNKGYGPDNCRWAIPSDQSRNRRSNKWIDYNGMRYTQSDLADKLGIPRRTLAYRVRQGWPVEMLSSAPNLKHGLDGRFVSKSR
jgi:hypothetical protein